MTKKEIKIAWDNFSKEHSPNDYKNPSAAISHFWGIVICGSSSRNRHVNEWTRNSMSCCITDWWFDGKTPLLESDLLESLDTKFVTHEWMWYSCRYAHNLDGFGPEEAAERLFDLSFKYNIIGVAQKPGDLRIWIKESEDHQTNITGEVVEKIAKCLEY